MIGYPTLDKYSFKQMPVLVFDRPQYDCLEAFLEYLPTVPEIQKAGSFIISPAHDGLIDFPEIKAKIDAIQVKLVLRQRLKYYGKCVVPQSTNVTKSRFTAKDFFKTGSCNNEDPDEQVVEFFRDLKEKELVEDYGSDITACFTSGHELIDLPKLAKNSCLKYEPAFQAGRVLTGIHESYFYLGKKNTVAGLHREDVDMGSINLMLWAEEKAEKMWFATGVDHCLNVQMRLTDLCFNVMDNCPKSYWEPNLCCSNFFRRKGLLVPLDVFEEWMTEPYIEGPTVYEPVPVFRGRQRPGDLVVTLPRSWHQVYNTGINRFF